MLRYERDRSVVLGYVPIRRDMFPVATARQLEEKIRARVTEIVAGLNGVELVNIDDVVEGGMLWDHRDVEKVVFWLQEKRVDAVFFPHCNFGQEEVAALVAKELGKPVCLWGPRDPSPAEDKSGKTGPRAYDTQCGMFATSRAFHRYGIPFTYIENCWVESGILDRELEKFIRVASTVKAFRGMRVGQLGTRPRPFLSVKINESELMRRFGIDIVPIWPQEVENMAKKLRCGAKPNASGSELQLEAEPEQGEPDPRIAEIMEDIRANLDLSELSEEKLEQMAVMELSILELAKINRLDAIAVECWGFSRAAFGVSSCFVLGDLFDRGLPAACETDLHAAIGAVLLEAASRYEGPAWVADVTIRHPENDNAELLWHCGPFAKSLKKEGVQGSIRDEKGMFEIKGGPITVARFEQDNGKYMLFADEGVGTDGPTTTGNYVWFEVKDWVKWEKKLMYGPYIHHITGIHGSYAAILKEACRYFGDVGHDSVEPVEY